MKKRTIKIIIAFILFLVSLVISFENVWINSMLYIISYLIVGLDIVIKAVRNIFRGKIFDENFLMTIATIGAFAIGEFPEAVAVMLFYQVGELFQSYAVDKSRKSIASLMDIRPDFANLKKDGKIEKCDPEEINIEDIIIIKPGEKVPLDGTVIDGNSMLDTSALTGESIPREVTVGDDILSGCINQTGLLEVKVTKKFGESTVSKILDLVENASSKKSKSENFISKFAKYYTPIVVVIAILLAIIPPIIFKETEFTEWLYRALTFLVVSCPCALVISIPLGFFGGIGGASKLGILVKGSNYLEALSNTEIVVFDKTGTLTEGVFEVQKINPVDISKEDLIKYAAYAESFSNHPIAISLIKAYGKSIDSKIISETSELSGLGVNAIVDGKNILVGNEKLMKEKNITYEKCNEIGTILYVAMDNKFVGTITISDKIKVDAKDSIERLKRNNVKKTIMLTGDKIKVAENVASKLNIDEVYAELLPSDKVEKVEELLQKKSAKGKVAFVGDGINDAPALVNATIGISVNDGTDVAMDSADVILMNNDISNILDLIKISKKAFPNSK